MTLPIIRGMNVTSELDIDHFAPTIFLDGCNLRCPYCMNSKLVKSEVTTQVGIETVKKYIEDNSSEWVVVSGGEVTCHASGDLRELFNELRSCGCKIAITTNGTYSPMLSNIIPIVDYVAMDIKCWDDELIDCFGYCNLIKCSYVDLLNWKKAHDGFDFEIRTTLYPPFVTDSALHAIGDMLRHYGHVIYGGDDFLPIDISWYLQQFRCDKNMMSATAETVEPYCHSRLKELLIIAYEYVKNVNMRYV